MRVPVVEESGCAVRAAALPEFAAAVNDIRSGKARSRGVSGAFASPGACEGNKKGSDCFLRANLAERAVEKTLATVTKVCG